MLPPDYTFVAGDAGSHVFNVTLNTTGSQSISATDTVTSSITGTQTGIVVGPAGWCNWSSVAIPARPPRAPAIDLTVTATDASNNTATGYLGTVHFSSSDGAAVLPPDYTFVAGDADTTSSTSRSTPPAANRSAPPTRSRAASPARRRASSSARQGRRELVVSGYPSATTAGASHSLTVTATDASNNTATGYLGTVHFSSSGSGRRAAPRLHLRRGRRGQPRLQRHAQHRRQPIDQRHRHGHEQHHRHADGHRRWPGRAARLVVSGYPSATNAGASHSLTVTATVASNNTATGYLGTVHFSSSDGPRAAPHYTFVAGDAGSHVFNVTLNTAGSQSISATDTVTSSITGTQTGIVVNVTSLSPYARKQAAVAELQALLPTGSHAADKRLNKAIQNITASLAMWRWNGADALSPLHGWKVFNYEKRAVSRLWTGPILSDPVLSHTANDAINQLIAPTANWSSTPSPRAAIQLPSPRPTGACEGRCPDRPQPTRSSHLQAARSLAGSEVGRRRRRDTSASTRRQCSRAHGGAAATIDGALAVSDIHDA